MPKRINPVAIVITTAMLAILFAVLVTIVIFKADSSQEKLPVLGNITGFELTERRGSSFTKSDLLGKINVVNFFFTSCQGPCPIMADANPKINPKIAKKGSVPNFPSAQSPMKNPTNGATTIIAGITDSSASCLKSLPFSPLL